MWILGWIIFGALVGWVASLIMGTDEQQGFAGNVIVGVIGAVLGGFISQAFGGEGITGFNIVSFILALIGAVVLIFLVRMFSPRGPID